MPSRSTAWISDAGTPERSANPSRSSSSSTRVPQLLGDGRREVGVGLAELAADDPADRREGEPLALEVADPPDPRGVFGAVPRDPALAIGLRQQPARLVVPDRVDRHVARGRELLHPIPHDQTLYECALERSTRPLQAHLRRPPGYDAPA